MNYGTPVVKIRSVLVEIDGDDDVITDENFEDSRMELRAAGHNLTAVLANPRESIFETFIDEFAMDQSEPIDILVTPSAAVASYSTPLKTPVRNDLQRSTHGDQLPDTGITLANLPSFSTAGEIEDLNKIVQRMKKMFSGYVASLGPFPFSVAKDSNGSDAFAGTPSSTRHNARMTRSPRSASAIAGISYGGSNRASYSRESAQARMAAQDAVVLCYRDVPDSFFRWNFSLQNSDTFNIALVPANVNKQESLSRYLDLVETALLKQIWVRSPAFFRALDDIKGLRGSVAEAITNVGSLKERIRGLDENLAVCAMRIPALQRRRNNENALKAKLLHMQKVLEAKKTVRMLLDIEDFVGALQVLANAKSIYDSELTSITSMVRVGQELDEYSALVAEIMSNKFVSVAIQWDDEEFEGARNDEDDLEKLKPPTTPLSPDSGSDVIRSVPFSSTNAPVVAVSDQQRQLNEELQGLMGSLLIAGRLQVSLSMYESRLCDSIRLIVRTCVVEYLSNFDPLIAAEMMNATALAAEGPAEGMEAATDTILAQKVREMSHENFLSCLTMVFEHVLLALKRSHRVHSFMRNSLLESCSDGSGEVNGNGISLHSNRRFDCIVVDSSLSDSSSREGIVASSKDCLTKASNLAQKSVAQLLTLRKDSVTRMKTDQMKILWGVCLKFIGDMELLGGSAAYVLRQALTKQTKSFLDHLHENCKGKLVSTLDNEKWAQVDVTPERQSDIDKLSSGKSFLSGLQPVRAVAVSTQLQNTSVDSSASGAGKKKEPRPVMVDGTSFKVVWSALLLAEISIMYLDIASSFTPIASEVISKVVEIHRLFDSRTQFLVLRAGAMQSAARLRSISAKHLAVTAQSIQVIVALLPHIRAALMALISQTHQFLLTELDRASNDLLEHHGLIIGKFVTIAGDSVDSSAQHLRGVDWDRFQGQSEYFEEITRNVTTLHRVLIEMLPGDVLQEVFSRIFAALSRKMPSHFEEIMPLTETGKQRILDEVTHIVSGFSRLKSVDATGPMSMLEDTFRRRYGR